MSNIYREITPLTQNDCFTIFSRTKKEFNFPLHYHDEFELNFIMNAEGAKRIVGDHIEMIGEVELVLIGANLSHAWFTHQCKSQAIHEITIQFHKDLLTTSGCTATNSASFGIYWTARRKGFCFHWKPRFPSSLVCWP